MSHINKLVFYGIVFYLCGFYSLVAAEEDRSLSVDREIGGMEQGSRIGAPAVTPTGAHQTISSSQGTKKTEASSVQPVPVQENHGNIYTNTDETNKTNSPITNENETGTNGSENTPIDETQTEPTETNGSGGTDTGTTEMSTNPIIDTDVNVDPESGAVEAGVQVDTSGELEDKQILDADLETQDGPSVDTEVDSASEITGQEAVEETDITTPDQTDQTSGSVQTGPQETTPQEPSEPSDNPIVETDVNINPDSGTVEADATVDTSGELEERQIFEADLEAEGVTSIDEDVSSAADITGEEIVEEADVTTPDQTNGSTQVGTGETTTQETTNPETTESSEPSNNPIVDADTNVNPESGTVEADVAVDTSGELEEKQILDADVAAGETVSSEPEVGSATDVTQSDTVEQTNVTTQPVTTVTTTSDLTAEVDTTGETTGGEADVGIEADVSGMSEGEDVACDPADALTSDTCGFFNL